MDGLNERTTAAFREMGMAAAKAIQDIERAMHQFDPKPSRPADPRVSGRFEGRGRRG